MARTPRIDRDAVIVAAIASGRTWDQAADAAGCSRSVVARRLAVPEIRAAVETERQRLAAQVADALTASVPAAVDRLQRIASTGTDRDAVNAARVLLGESRQWRDHRWVLDRLEAVEDALAEREAQAQ